MPRTPCCRIPRRARPTTRNCRRRPPQPTPNCSRSSTRRRCRDSLACRRVPEAMRADAPGTRRLTHCHRFAVAGNISKLQTAMRSAAFFSSNLRCRPVPPAGPASCAARHRRCSVVAAGRSLSSRRQIARRRACKAAFTASRRPVSGPQERQRFARLRRRGAALTARFDCSITRPGDRLAKVCRLPVLRPQRSRYRGQGRALGPMPAHRTDRPSVVREGLHGRRRLAARARRRLVRRMGREQSPTRLAGNRGDELADAKRAAAARTVSANADVRRDGTGKRARASADIDADARPAGFRLSARPCIGRAERRAHRASARVHSCIHAASTARRRRLHFLHDVAVTARRRAGGRRHRRHAQQSPRSRSGDALRRVAPGARRSRMGLRAGAALDAVARSALARRAGVARQRGSRAARRGRCA